MLLPAPMVEPIHTPIKPPPDSKPLPAQPALTVCFGSKSATFPQSVRNSNHHAIDWSLPPGDSPTMSNDGAESPSVLNLSDCTEISDALVASPYDRIAPGGTLPARPGLNEHSMNDAVVHQSPPLNECEDTASTTKTPAPPSAPPRLVVLRGVKINAEYPIYEGRNTIGRFADKPVDIDLLSQESVEQIWCSRQHAAITCTKGIVSIEDLNSLNGTWVNGARVHAGHLRQLKPGDVVQIGTVQMKFVVG